MRITAAITWKEIRSYFTSPIAYVATTVFVGICGYFFVDGLATPLAEASVRSYVGRATFVLTFLAPLLTMRLLSEEQKLGTLELLLTTPVRDWEVTLGKFLASVAVFLVALALTLAYVVLLFRLANPDPGPIVTAYLGLVLYACAALAIGLFTSSLTNNQIVAAVLSFGILLLLTVIHLAANQVGGVLATVLQQLSMVLHFEEFARGVITTRGIVYYVSMVAVFLFFTVMSLKSRRWI